MSTHGWGSSDRRSRLPADWAKRRARVLRRCGYRCEWVESGIRCPNKATDCDHVIPNDDHSDANLQGLCREHHNKKTISERPRLAPRRRPPERHPGAR